MNEAAAEANPGTPAEWLTTDIVDAVIRHMNDDHPNDTLTMARAARPDSIEASVVGLDHSSLHLLVQTLSQERVRVDLAWPRVLSTRADIRKAVVELHVAASEKLTQTPPAGSDHDRGDVVDPQ